MLASGVCLLAIFGYFYLSWATRFMDREYGWAFSVELGEYLDHHDGVMPQGWEDFTTWASQHEKMPWGRDLEKQVNFIIPWGQRICRQTPTVHITVVGPERIKHIEPSLNKYLQQWTANWADRD